MQALAELVAAGMPASLLMIGGQVGSSDPTNQAYLAHVEALIRTLGLSDRVRWTGFTSDQEVTANLLAADCAVLPYREGASLRHGSLMAALTHGLPIVTTSVPHGREVDEAAQAHFPRLRDGQSVLLVTPGDPAALANAVTRVMSEPALQQRLATGAADLSREFQWDTIARQHLAIYRV
jgi:glycosyltransferase involved in cell wall biosynthesis